MINKINSFLNSPKRKTNLDIKKRRKIALNNTIISKFKKRKNQLSLDFSVLKKFNFLWKSNFNYYILLSILIISSILFIFFWSFFKIKIINIIKKDNITDINIAYKSIESIRWKHIFFIDKKDFSNKLITYQNNIKNIEINIILPNTLKILIESYKWIFKTTINNKNYIITENGALIELKNNMQRDNSSWKIKNNNNILKNITIISDLINNSFLDYKIFFSENIINTISNSVKKLEENIINIGIKNLTYYELERELHMKLKNNTLLIFSLDWEIDNQIKKALIFNKDFLHINNNNIVYIDLRINNKIFYCLKETETDCKANIKKIYSK